MDFLEENKSTWHLSGNSFQFSSKILISPNSIQQFLPKEFRNHRENDDLHPGMSPVHLNICFRISHRDLLKIACAK